MYMREGEGERERERERERVREKWVMEAEEDVSLQPSTPYTA